MNEQMQSVCLAWLCLIFVGCTSRDYQGDQRFPLSGKVTCDGEIVDAGTIAFLPQSEKQRVSGGIIENGAYSIPEEKGANAGAYRVEIRWAKRTGKQYYDPELQMKVDARKEALPPRYHKDSELTAVVSPERTMFDFDLKSK